MFKTIYSKYLVSFMSLLGLGFCAIALIIISVVTSYSIETKNDLMDKTARMVYAEISSEMKDSKLDFSRAVSKEKDKFYSVFGSLSQYSQSSIILIDKNGAILFKNGENNLIKNTRISREALNLITNQASELRYSNLDGLFETRRFNYIYPVKESTDGKSELIGIILLSSSSSGMNEIYGKIIQVIIIASLWVFLAAMIIVYFITKRITTPIKQISRAVDSYTKGRFDVRIPIRGNDEITTLAVAFNNMASELQKLEVSKNTFISSVSHDLKTPMTSIQGFIEGIIDGTIPPEKYDYYLGIVLTEVKRLSRLVNSLLDLSRMESGGFRLNPQVFDVCEIARLIIISFEEKIDEKRINIEFNSDADPSNVYADKDAIYQVIYNIVSNALKFIPDEGTLKIDITRNKAQDKYTVSVFNTGDGIKKDELEYVFDRFYKADSSRGLDKTGTGLGLYIAKTKIEAHGETIGVESEYGSYCRFYFTLSSNSKNIDRVQSEK